MIFTIVTVLVVALLTALFLWYIQFKLQQKRNTIRYKDGRPLTGPPPLFPFGNIKELKDFGSLSLAIKHWRKKYGNEFQFWFGARSFVYLHDLDAMKEISSQFHPRFQTWAQKEFWKKGIIMTDDPVHHKIHRAAALTRLLSTSYLKRIAHITSDKADRLIEVVNSQSGGKPVEVQADAVLQRVTFDIIGQAAFSMDFQATEESSKYTDSYIRPLRQFLEGAVDLARAPYIIRYFYYLKFLAVKANKKRVDDFHRMILHERREEKKRGISQEDFMDYLITEKDPRTNSNFDEEDIVSDIADLLGAGHETTSNVVCFALYFLAWNLDVQKTLQEECCRFPSNMTYEDAGRLSYTHAVIKETLRLQPPGEGFHRQCETREEYRNIIVPAKSVFYFSIVEFGHDPNYFPDPEKFDPARWLHEESAQQAWFAFGSGVKSCIGNRMGMVCEKFPSADKKMESKILLCKLMQKFSVRRLTDAPLEVESALTSRPKGGLKLQFIPRT